MADLTVTEEFDLEALLDMGDGYILDFTNDTFRRFVFKSTRIDVYDEKKEHYRYLSKAKKLRTFWHSESNYQVAKLMGDLLEYWQSWRTKRYESLTEEEKALLNKCERIVDRLSADSPVENIDAIEFNSDEKNFAILASQIRESVRKNEPEAALDRLHTFLVFYLRQLFDNNGISYEKTTPLNSLLGGYIKYLKDNNKIETVMTERILKSNISWFDAFNNVRNDKSYAHSNEVLNYNESVYVINSILNTIKYIRSIEEPETNSVKTEVDEINVDVFSHDDIPF